MADVVEGSRIVGSERLAPVEREIPNPGEFDGLLHEGALLTALVLGTSRPSLEVKDIVRRFGEIQENRGWEQNNKIVETYIGRLAAAGVLEDDNGTYSLKEEKRLPVMSFALRVLSNPLMTAHDVRTTYKKTFGGLSSSPINVLRLLYQYRHVPGLDKTVLDAFNMSENVYKIIRYLAGEEMQYIANGPARNSSRNKILSFPNDRAQRLFKVLDWDIVSEDRNIETEAEAFLAETTKIVEIIDLLEKDSQRAKDDDDPLRIDLRIMQELAKGPSDVMQLVRTLHSSYTSIVDLLTRFRAEGMLVRLDERNVGNDSFTGIWHISPELVERVRSDISGKVGEMIAEEPEIVPDTIMSQLQNDGFVANTLLVPIIRQVVEELHAEYGSPEGIWRTAVRKMLRGEPGQFVIVYRKRWPDPLKVPGEVFMYIADDQKAMVSQLAAASHEDEYFLPELYRSVTEDTSGIKTAMTSIGTTKKKDMLPDQPNMLIMEIIDTAHVRQESALGLDIVSTQPYDDVKHMRWKALLSFLGSDSAVLRIINEEKERISNEADLPLRRRSDM